MSENERETARLIANEWLECRINAFPALVPGDPDCDGCILARQYMRALDTINALQDLLRSLPSIDKIEAVLASRWPKGS